MTILEDGGTTAHRLGLALIRIPPRTSGPPTHWHARHDETFYVVEGTAHFVTANGEHKAPAGTLVTVPPGAVHTFANRGDDECVLLNTFTPDLYVEYFRDLAGAQSVGESLSGERILEIMSRYWSYPAKARNEQPG
jgi:oxalate decarboxylase/phosphoglucose isomerase-like protein (cupin superfamily)